MFEYFFEGDRKGRGRDNILKLEVIAKGEMNAVAFWFDLHLDAEESICSGTASQASALVILQLCQQLDYCLSTFTG